MRDGVGAASMLLNKLDRESTKPFPVTNFLLIEYP